MKGDGPFELLGKGMRGLLPSFVGIQVNSGHRILKSHLESPSYFFGWGVANVSTRLRTFPLQPKYQGKSSPIF